MKLNCRRRETWFESYGVFDEAKTCLYTVTGKRAWGHRLVVLDAAGQEVAVIKQKLFTRRPQMLLIVGGEERGSVTALRGLFGTKVRIAYRDWQADIAPKEKRIALKDAEGVPVVSGTWVLRDFREFYTFEVAGDEHLLDAVMLLTAIDLCEI